MKNLGLPSLKTYELLNPEKIERIKSYFGGYIFSKVKDGKILLAVEDSRAELIKKSFGVELKYICDGQL